jgi:formyltetrahydrofolate-dependent phosphoribosylglycinamide formyltransferase
MLDRLKKRWKASGWKLILILITFAIGGSLTGIVGKKLMAFTGIQNTVAYIFVYVIVITIIWPAMVLIISIPLGQFCFFKKYIGKIGTRIFRKEISNEKFQMKNSKFQLQPSSVDHRTSPAARAGNQKTETSNIKHITIFASGAGSNAKNIIDHFKNSNVRIALIVCNKHGAGVISIAQKEAIPLLLIEKEKFFKGDGYVPELQKAKTDLIVLAGFLWKIPQCLIESFPKNIINIHPALLPKYGGKGMYGQYVHQSVINNGELQSGITIHYVDGHYDNGDVIFQTACRVMHGDTPEILAQRIHQLEHLHYPEVIKKVLLKI